MFPNTLTGISPDWLVHSASSILGPRAPTPGERRALYAVLAHAANVAIIKAAPSDPRLLRDPVRALEDMNAAWRDVALLGVPLREYETAVALLASGRSPSEYAS